MKRHLWISLLAAATVVLLGACAPAPVMSNVVPTLYSVQLPQDGGDTVTLQGRYFGSGPSGEELDDADSYVVIGARSDCTGGVRVAPNDWSAGRISFDDPGGVGQGFVCVVADGATSNGLPANLN